jgi:hypothetical protein
VSLLLVLLLGGCPPTTTDATCGELTCTGGEVCLQESYEPECTNREDTGAACPDGTTATMCGGAGMPCCCGPDPARTSACIDPGACGATPTCDCLGDICPEGKMCVEQAADGGTELLCEPMPKP